MRISAGCGVPDTTPAPEIMYQYAQGAQKGQQNKTAKQPHTHTKKKYIYWRLKIVFCKKCFFISVIQTVKK